ncbi:hypothetical protein ACFYXF_27050 [Streptomyces sp. NPDC002680]|uniref:hypothetical protein n=1 Tax=Streptomyces sp. NPDC002680 TaxID=3364659 RepID=UPI0036BACD37
MHDASALAATAGAVLCLVGHVPGPARHWAPHAITLAVMTLMLPPHTAPGILLAGAGALAAACLWAATKGCPARRPADAVDLATMATLTAVTARVGHLDGTHMPHHGTWEPTPFLFLTGCWAIARAAAHLHTRLALIGPANRTPRPRPPYRSVLLRESGGLAMVAGMAAMLT